MVKNLWVYGGAISKVVWEKHHHQAPITTYLNGFVIPWITKSYGNKLVCIQRRNPSKPSMGNLPLINSSLTKQITMI